MATLKSSRGEFRAPCRCLLGRSTLAELRLDSRRGSNEHASLGWYSGRWILRDLGSSNGTKVNGKSLFPGDRTPIEPGSRLQFGDEGEVWTMVDCDAPDPCAILLGPQQMVWGAQTLLVLPATDAPEASVFADAEVWRFDTGVDVRTIECGDIVTLPSGYWRVLVPELAGCPQARTAGPELGVAEISLVFSAVAGQVSVTIQQGATRVSLPSRACLNTLIALSRLRMRDRVPEPARGWVSVFDLADMLHSGPEKVNVDIHRLRKLFQDAGVRNAQRIIERDGAKKVRIGVSRLVEVEW
jgi:FHA domain